MKTDIHFHTNTMMKRLLHIIEIGAG